MHCTQSRRRASLLLAALAAGIGGCVTRPANVERAATEQSQGAGSSRQWAAIVPIAAFTARGDLPRLLSALQAGLQAGLTVREIEEVLVQMYAYAGFPRSLNAITALLGVLEERRQAGVVDVVGSGPTPRSDDRSSIEIGEELRTRMVGGPMTAPYAAFSPTIDTFLKAHLFGDILTRDNLEIRSREVATIAALAALDGLEPQLTSHFRVARNVGLTEAELREVVAVLGATVGSARGERAGEVLTSALRDWHGGPPAQSPNAIESQPEAPTIQVRSREQQRVTIVPAAHFTGSAQVRWLFAPAYGTRASGAIVTFEPRARTAWHVHPLGQTLLVTQGSGWVQQRGHSPMAIGEGDVVHIPPGVEHWHGATAHSAMAHLAVQERVDGNTVRWLEPVSDEQYPAGDRERDDP